MSAKKFDVEALVAAAQPERSEAYRQAYREEMKRLRTDEAEAEAGRGDALIDFHDEQRARAEALLDIPR